MALISMDGTTQPQTYETVIQVVLELLQSDGSEAVQVRTVAKRARVSLTTLYKLFPTRDDLIVAALVHWMDENGYSQLAAPPPDASLDEALISVYRQIFAPWERTPKMLEAYQRARTGPGGNRLDMQGMAAVGAVVAPFFARLDPGYADDLALVLTNMVCGAIDRFAVGDLAVSEIMPVLERAVVLLTTDNAALAAGQPAQHGRTES